ncbi:hypothetical protein C1X30_35920, partial [Pseudomonas sp. FW305-BF6]|uniref:flagellar basal body FlgE domain-containing protein n=1 Tax=Pseudomonas sp. FW305-BF6 TaxID=2070673 RepID=UPI000CA95710
VRDSLGNEVPLNVVYTKTGSNSWSVAVQNVVTPPAVPTTYGTGNLNFNPDGSLVVDTTPPITYPFGANVTIPSSVG